jgi:hypothetical protein
VICGFSDESFGSLNAINSCTVRATASKERRELSAKYLDSKISKNRSFGDRHRQREI